MSEQRVQSGATWRDKAYLILKDWLALGDEVSAIAQRDKLIEEIINVQQVAYEEGITDGRFALNSELGIESNEAAKAARLETFMHHIVTQDMVPLPVERIREWAKELLG